MVEVPTIIIILIGLALLIVIFIEAKEYHKYVHAATALTAFAEGMQQTFMQTGEQMSRFVTIQNALALDAEEKDRRMQLMDLTLAAHTEILTLKLLGEVSKAVTPDA